MKRKNGFTLVEMLIVVVLIGAVLLIGWPKVAAGLAKTNLRSSRTTVANMFAKARTFAMQSNRTTSINFNGNNVVITASPRTLGGVGNTVDSIGGVEKLSEAYGVALTPARWCHPLLGGLRPPRLRQPGRSAKVHGRAEQQARTRSWSMG